jgi:hypothetical protein
MVLIGCQQTLAEAFPFDLIAPSSFPNLLKGHASTGREWKCRRNAAPAGESGILRTPSFRYS